MHSVVIPHFNQPDTLSNTITSLLRQTRVPDQILIVDDGSTVPLPVFMSPVRVLYLARHPRGYPQHATCVNAGVAHTTGEQVTVMCGNWTFPDTFCERIRARVQPGTVWCGANAGQGFRRAETPQEADTGLQYHMHRGDWVDWEEGFDRLGGNHHVVWWVLGRMRAGIVFEYDPGLGGRHHHPPFQDNAQIALNPTASWNAYRLLERGVPPEMAFAQIGIPETPEMVYSRTEPVCHCPACTANSVNA